MPLLLSARVVPDGMEEIHGLKMPGTGLPGVIMVGTWRDGESVTFAVCHGRQAVVLDLADQVYDRIVVTVEDPEAAVAALTKAAGRLRSRRDGGMSHGQSGAPRELQSYVPDHAASL